MCTRATLGLRTCSDSFPCVGNKHTPPTFQHPESEIGLTGHLYYLQSPWREAASFLNMWKETLVLGYSSVLCMLLEITVCGRVQVGRLEGLKARRRKGWKARGPENFRAAMKGKGRRLEAEGRKPKGDG